MTRGRQKGSNGSEKPAGEYFFEAYRVSAQPSSAEVRDKAAQTVRVEGRGDRPCMRGL
jgi:hypothetical protein